MSAFDSTKRLLPDILGDIVKGKIQLPDFQRGWVWDDEHVRSLLVSIAPSISRWRRHAVGNWRRSEVPGAPSRKSAFCENHIASGTAYSGRATAANNSDASFIFEGRRNARQ
jgi:hypothetical protein